MSRLLRPAMSTAVLVCTVGCGATTAEEPAMATDPVPSSPIPESTPDGAGRVVVDARGMEVQIESIERIIPLDGDVAEVVFALGLGDHVVATDLSATYPPEADALPQIGYQRALGTEPILAFDPTLLVATDLAGPPETIEALERVGVPLVIVPDDPTSTGPATKIRAVAAALGVPDRGEDLAAKVEAEIATALAAHPTSGTAPRVVALYVRGTSAQLVLGEEYSVHWLVEAAGGDDISDELGVTGSAPITSEALVAAAPDVIVVPASGLESVGGAEGLLEVVPALAETPAGRARAVLAYDDQLLLGNGPRTGALLSTLVTDLAQYRAPEPGGDRP